jgi:hypothetical protein
LGAKATLNFRIAPIKNKTEKYTLELIDISGEKWTQKVAL